MAVRPHETLENAITRTYTVVAGGSTTKGLPVKFDTSDGECTVCAAGDDGFGIALSTEVAGAKVEVALLAGACIIPVKVGTGGATRGLYGIAATDGIINRALGGGTTSRNILVKFLQTGVVGDFVGAMPANFSGVSS